MRSAKKLILIGAGGHSRACIDVIERCGTYEIAGLVGLSHEVGEIHLGYQVIAANHDLPLLATRFHCAIVAVGQIHSADIRVRIYHQLISLGFKLPTIVSPLAYVSAHASIGLGSIVMHGAVVNAGAIIGQNSIINSQSLIEHDAKVGDHSHIATGAILNGGTRVGNQSLVGSGSIIKQGVSIGNACLVGMGLSVRHNLPDGEQFVGETKA